MPSVMATGNRCYYGEY